MFPASRNFLTAAAAAATLVLTVVPLALAQKSGDFAAPAITLEKTTPAAAVPLTRSTVPGYAVEARQFGPAMVDKSSPPQVFTLDFHATTRIISISASNDFHVSGGTCIEGHTYSAGNVCSVEVILTPQGPGRRTGTLTVAHSASGTPLLVPSGGVGYGPVVSFTPSQISTVPSTMSAGTGVLNSAQGLAVDGGDNLFIADTGNGLIRYQDSGGILSILAGGGTNTTLTSGEPAWSVRLSSPYGVATDTLGDVWISDTGNKVVRLVGPSSEGLIDTEMGQGPGTDPCTFTAPCSPTAESLPAPYGIAVGLSGNVFVNVADLNTAGFGASLAEDADALFNPSFYNLMSGFDFYSENYPLAVDAYDDLYYPYELPAVSSVSIPALCNIYAQNPAYGIDSTDPHEVWVVAGTNHCGFSGDGGLATGAEISASVQGLAFDAAGNFYFTDSGNNRVRRIDAATGIIRTIAGNGTAGDTGDGGPATAAELNAPTGIGVDSRGNVFVISVQKAVQLSSKPAPGYTDAPASTSGNKTIDVVREVGAMGQLVFPAQLVSTASPARTILVSNVGNDALTFTHVALVSGNTGDFSIDPNTTTCNFTMPLSSGQNCLLGMIFKPSATGSRSAILRLLDNTVTGSNEIEVSGVSATAAKAAIAPTALTFASQVAGTSSAAQPVTLSDTGGFPLTIGSYTFTGANATDFSQTHTCGAKLLGGDTCTVDVTFKPAAAGSPTATFTVSTSAGAVSVTIKGTSTAVRPKVTLASKTNPAASKQPVVFNSKVASSSPVGPTGKVELRQGSTVLATATLSGGVASFSLTNLSVGTHELTAYYLGDKAHEASESPAIKQVVTSTAKTRTRTTME